MRPLPGDVKDCDGPRCNQKIIWVEVHDPDQPEKKPHRMPLSAVPAVYHLTERYMDGPRSVIVADRERSSFVSHFVTCPDRDRFSNKKKK